MGDMRFQEPLKRFLTKERHVSREEEQGALLPGQQGLCLKEGVSGSQLWFLQSELNGRGA
jgi:hypothetical protein